jgi:hypothetical protein
MGHARKLDAAARRLEEDARRDRNPRAPGAGSVRGVHHSPEGCGFPKKLLLSRVRSTLP